MKYSYIEPRKKVLFPPEIFLTTLFFGVVFLFIGGVLVYLNFQIDRIESEKLAVKHEIKQIEYQIDEAKKDIASIEKGIEIVDKLKERNIFFYKSISNILDIVPDKITLTKVIIEKKKLIIYGETPSKDIFNSLMLAPLRSIFDKSYTSFILIDNGWYRFVSYNYMDKNVTIFRPKK